MRTHSFLSGNYLIAGSSFGGWSQNGRLLASKVDGGHSGCPIELARYCYKSMLHARRLVQKHLSVSSLYLPSEWRMRSDWVASQGDVTSQLTLGRDPHGGPSLRCCPSHFLTVFLGFCSIIYWPTHTARSATVAVSEAGVPQCCRVYACFLGSSMPSELYMNSWIDACFIA